MTKNGRSKWSPGKGISRHRRKAAVALVALTLFLVGCHRAPPKVVTPAPKPPVPAPTLLQIGEKHFNSGEYVAAALAYEGYLRENPEASDRDRALFKLALCYGLGEDGPDRYQKAQKQFTLLVTQFPRSQYKLQAEYILSLQGEIERLKVDMRGTENLIRERVEPPAKETTTAEESDKSARQKDRALLRQKDKIIQDKEKEIQDKDELIRKLTQELERMKKIDLGRKPSRPPG